MSDNKYQPNQTGGKTQPGLNKDQKGANVRPDAAGNINRTPGANQAHQKGGFQGGNTGKGGYSGSSK